MRGQCDYYGVIIKVIKQGLSDNCLKQMRYQDLFTTTFFCVVSTLFSFKIRSTDHYCKTTRSAKSRFSINIYPFGFISRRFFSAFKREVISSLLSAGQLP